MFHHSEDDRKYEVLKMEHLATQNDAVDSLDNNDIETAIEEERQEQEVHVSRPRPKPRTRTNNYYSSNNYYKQYTLSTPSSASTLKYVNTDSNSLSNTL